MPEKQYIYLKNMDIIDLVRLRTQIPDNNGLILDAQGIERLGTNNAWLIQKILERWKKENFPVQLVSASPEVIRSIDQAAQYTPPQPSAPVPSHFLWIADLGKTILNIVEHSLSFLEFLGENLRGLGYVLRHPGSLRVRLIVEQMRQVGINALFIVGLMSFLIGIVIAQQGTVQLRQFGAQNFTINLLGRSIIRELGVLMTAIMVAGRSGSAFSAEIGSMKLAEEIDALRTMGISPTEFLTLPRILATLIMLPLLAFYANMCGLLGGYVFSFYELDITPTAFLLRIRSIIPPTDLYISLLKAPLFGFIIAVTGCFYGMQAHGSAESVGRNTTLSVVQSIFLVIVFDALFAVFFTMIGWV